MKLPSTTVMQTYFEHDLGRWILPTVGTAAFLLLLMHKSEFPVVFNRYSIEYAILLALAGLNVSLLWRKPLLRVSCYALLSYIALVFVYTLLFDFFILGLRLPFFLSTEQAWVSFVFVATSLVLMNTRRHLIRRIYPAWKPFRIFRRMFMVACSVMFVVIPAEVVLRLFLLERLTPKNQEEFLRLVSAQWREPIATSKPNDTFRILGLADSMGVVPDTSSNYHYLLEDTLRHQSPPKIQMVNVSVTGYAPRHELAMLRLAKPYSSDLVLHGFFVGNDFTLQGEDTYRYGAIRIDDEPGARRYRPSQFFLVDVFHNELLFLRDRRQIRLEERNGIVQKAGHLSKKFFMDMQWRRMNYLYKPSSKDDMEKVIPILKAIRYAAEEAGGRYVMIIHPDRTQVDERLRREIAKTYNVSEDDYDFDFPQKVLMSYCAASGTFCLNLLPGFRANAKQNDLYLVLDGHYSVKGNQLAAAMINQFLSDKQLIRSASPGLTRKP